MPLNLPENFADAAAALVAGELVVFPTETFYAIGADPMQPNALAAILQLKGRESGKPIALIAADRLSAFAIAREIPASAGVLAEKFWPGPLTIIVKAASRLPLKVTANTGNVALRVPAAKIPLAVVKAAAIPITATSANLSGASECTTAEQVRDQLQDRISIIVDGGTSPREVASTIVDLSDEESRWRVIREGAIPAQEISAFFAQG